MDAQVNQRANGQQYLAMPIRGPDDLSSVPLPVSSNARRPQEREYSVEAYHKFNWDEYTHSPWCKRLRHLLLAGAIIMTLLALVEAIIAGFHCGADIITTTDYSMWNGAQLPPGFATTLENKGVCPVCAIWAAGYFASAVAFWLIFAMYDRFWKSMVNYWNPAGILLMQSFYYALVTLAVFMLIGVSNIFLLVSVCLIAMAICVLNGIAMYMAVHRSTVHSESAQKNPLVSSQTILVFLLLVAGTFTLALGAFAWAYFANMIFGEGALQTPGYKYAMIIIMTVNCIVHAILNLYYIWKVQKKHKGDPKKVSTIGGRTVHITFAHGLVIVIFAGCYFLTQVIGVHV